MSLLPTDAPEFIAKVQDKRQKRMDQIDRLPPAMRELVHAYGYSVVYQFIQAGVVKPNQIKHLVETVLDEFSPTRGSYAKQGIRTPVNIAKATQP